MRVLVAGGRLTICTLVSTERPALTTDTRLRSQWMSGNDHRDGLATAGFTAACVSFISEWVPGEY